MQYEKPLRIGKTERYELSLTSWLAGETLLTATVTPDAKATISPAADIAGDVIGFFLTGVSHGGCKVHIDYTTATRTDCTEVVVIVLPC